MDGRKDERVAVVAQLGMNRILQVCPTIPARRGDDSKVDIAIDVGLIPCDGPEEDDGLDVVADCLAYGVGPAR